MMHVIHGTTRSLFAAALLGLAGAATLGGSANAANAAGDQPAPPRVAANCPASTTFDSTTPEQARAKIASAGGYWNIRDLVKNCDNTWQATAENNGEFMRVVLSADDQVVQGIN
jgi:hypothetical protein